MKYRLTFNFCKTEEDAKTFCDSFNNEHKGWKKHRATYTTWSGKDSGYHFVAWYYV